MKRAEVLWKLGIHLNKQTNTKKRRKHIFWKPFFFWQVLDKRLKLFCTFSMHIYTPGMTAVRYSNQINGVVMLYKQQWYISGNALFEVRLGDSDLIEVMFLSGSVGFVYNHRNFLALLCWPRCAYVIILTAIQLHV